MLSTKVIWYNYVDMIRNSLILAALIICAAPMQLHTAMTGGNFELYADSFSVISTDVISGGSFELTQTVGEFFAATSTGGGIELRGGFQAEEKGILSATTSAAVVNLGTLDSGAVDSGSITYSISTDSETGYSLAIREDGNLRDGADDIDDVADGTVTAGSEEYGIGTGGSDGLYNAADTSITGVSKPIAVSSGRVTNRQTTVTFKASIDGVTDSGSYSHTVFLDVTVNP